MQGLHACLKAFNLYIDDCFRAARFNLPLGGMRADRVLQVVNVVNEDAIQLVHGGIDIARNSDVDEKHRAISPAGQKTLSVLAAENRNRSARGGDHDVRLLAVVVEFVEADGTAAEVLGQALGAFISPVGNKNGPRSSR